jgi:chromosomal replication initiator protein
MAAHPAPARQHRRDAQPAADPHALESALRSAVAERLGEPRFGLWFGEGVRLGLSGDGDSLEVRVPNAFFGEWIKGQFAGSLAEAARAVTGRPVRLSFAIHDEAEPPLGDVVPPDEDRSRPPAPVVTVPLPGNPKTPLSSPPPRPSGPDRPVQPRFAMPSAAPRPATADPALPGRPARRLDDFMTGACNRLAHAAAREMIHTAGSVFNPLVIHGGVGLGKTHLLEAIAHGLRQTHRGMNVLCITAEAFTNGFLDAMRAGTLASFRARYRGVGALVIDDIHFLAGTRATQGEFLHTFNALVEKGAAIVVTADQHPRRIARLTDELATRFLGGMVVKLDTPAPTTRKAILQAKSAARGVSVPAAVIDYIAEHVRASVRELEGALHSVIAHALLSGKKIDLPLARSALRDTIRHTACAVGLRDVERAVCQLFQVDPEALKSDGRARAIAYPRMLAMYLARKHTGAAYSEIGRHFGGRNHSTVISAEKKVLGWLKDEQQNGLLPGFETIADVLADLERTLGA